MVLRRLAYVGSGISHAAFGGVALAALAGLPPVAGGAVAALLVALAAARASESASVSEDSAIGVFTVAAMAAGVVALGFLRTNVDLYGLMFGNILTVAPSDLLILGVTAVLVLAGLGRFFRPLLLASIDEDGARAAGVNVKRLRLLLLTLIALSIVAALKVVGLLLVSALLVLPGATARPLCARWPALLAASIAASTIMVIGGLFLSVALDVASGAAIILLGTALFLLAVLKGRARA